MRAFDNHARSLPERAPLPSRDRFARDVRRTPKSRDWQQAHFVWIG